MRQAVFVLGLEGTGNDGWGRLQEGPAAPCS